MDVVGSTDVDVSTAGQSRATRPLEPSAGQCVVSSQAARRRDNAMGSWGCYSLLGYQTQTNYDFPHTLTQTLQQLQKDVQSYLKLFMSSYLDDPEFLIARFFHHQVAVISSSLL